MLGEKLSASNIDSVAISHIYCVVAVHQLTGDFVRLKYKGCNRDYPLAFSCNHC
jgi:hypothetical protein